MRYQGIEPLRVEVCGRLDSCKRPRGAIRGRLASMSASPLACLTCTRQISPRLLNPFGSNGSIVVK
jgi:hypothetical protein